MKKFYQDDATLQVLKIIGFVQTKTDNVIEENR